MYNAALDNMAGEAVGVLFASMADRALGIDVDGGNNKRSDSGSSSSRPGGGRGGRRGPTADERPGTDETEKRQEPRRSGNQAEEESGPGEEGHRSGDQQAEGNGDKGRVGGSEATGGGGGALGVEAAAAASEDPSHVAGAVDPGVSRWVFHTQLLYVHSFYLVLSSFRCEFGGKAWRALGGG